MQKNILIAVAVIAVAVFGWITYQAQVVIPQERIDSQERLQASELREERMKEISRTSDYNSCKSRAWDVYSDDWDASCKIAGKEADCSLYNSQSKIVEERYQNKLADCLAIYKAN